MNPEIVSELAKKIAQAQFTENWKYYLVLLALIAISSFLGGLLNAYTAERGKFRAIEENFDKVLAQLEKTTTTTKGIELALSHNDWTSREYKTLRRDKLEKLMYGVYETRDWVAKSITVDHERGEFEVESSPVRDVVVIANLYFPELKLVNDKFFSIHQNFIINALDEARHLRDAEMKAKVVSLEIDMLKKIGTEESMRKAAEMMTQLDQANHAFLEVKKQFQEMLLPIYKDLHESLLEYAESIESLMAAIITPSE
jgi:hypothetical protein